MPYRAIAICFLAVALLSVTLTSVALPGRREVIAAAEDTFRLSGRVTNDYGCALFGVTVLVSAASAPSKILATATTDANGRYSFDRLPDVTGPVKLAAELNGFRHAERVMSLARNYPNIWDAGLVLGRLFDPGFRLAGAVVDERKRPVADATVTLIRPHIDGDVVQVRTDMAGRFLFEVVDEGALIVIVTRPSFEAASRLVDATPWNSKAAPEVFTLATCKRCPEGRLQ
jgi:hypothetical protein